MKRSATSRYDRCHVVDDDDVSSEGAVNDIGDKGGYSPPAIASSWENGGSLLGEEGMGLPTDDGS